MTLHFAAARTPARSHVARVLTPALVRRAMGSSANDNGELYSREAITEAALRHFAETGLAAASSARERAEQAMTAGEAEQYIWWLEICRAFDRGQARQLERNARKVANW